MIDAGLITAAEHALAAEPQQRTVRVRHAGKNYIAKRLAEKPRRLLQTLFVRWLVKRITGQPLPLRTLALSEAAHSMHYEATRLQSLAAAGASVPHLAHQTTDYLLLEDCGTVVATQLEGWTPAVWRDVLLRLANDLGQLHARGLWHGGAQIKNVTLQNGDFTRIDFEENFGEFLPLSVCHATDLILFLNSISLAGPIDKTESRLLLPQLLSAYVAAHPDNAAIRQTLKRTLPWLRRLAFIACPLRRFTRKSLLRIEILIDVLDGFLHPR
ncbi:MAG: hypothetical protein K2X64_02085 [Rhodocyclaceae bacterium]|nr:hypothetical protein [Rhodocyclaceae bacterium]